jgi:hypothetical protein
MRKLRDVSMGNATFVFGREHEVAPERVMRTAKGNLSSSYATGGDLIPQAERDKLMWAGAAIADLTDCDVMLPTLCKWRTTVNATAALNSATITVVSTTGFGASGTITILGTKITYTGKTATTFTGCSNHPAYAVNDPVVQSAGHTVDIDKESSTVRVYNGTTEIAAATDLSTLWFDLLYLFEDVGAFGGQGFDGVSG